MGENVVVEVLNPGGSGGGSLADHQHTASGDGGDTIVAQNVTGVLKVRAGDDGATPGELSMFDGVTVGRTVSLVPHSGGMTASRIIALPDVNGTVPLIGTGLDDTAVAGTLARVQRTGQTANITAKKLSNTVPAGFYSVWAYLVCTSGSGGAGTISLNLQWTDSTGGQNKPAVPLAMTTTGVNTNVVYPIYLASGNITYTVTGYTAGTYELRIRCVSMEA